MEVRSGEKMVASYVGSSLKRKTHQFTEALGTEAAPDACVAADQNLPGFAVVR